jgi:hypothetical protein
MVRDVRRGAYSAEMRPRLVPPLFIAGFLAVVVTGCGGGSDTSQADKDKAIAAAKFLYAGQAKRDLSSGPCLSQSLPGISDWAVDIAHDPRQPVDDRPANQCQSVRDGETDHFVELTPAGQLIRAQ